MSIALPPTTREFGEAQEEEFLTHVREIDAQTTTVPIERPADVALADDGTLAQDGYHFSLLAFSQLCQCVASGLSMLVEDLSGLRRRSASFDSVVSLPIAARILNTCVELRFRAEKGPYGRLMIRDTKRRVVEGIVGPGYRYLPHCELYEGVREMLEQADPPARFAGAWLLGRRLSLCMLGEPPLFRTRVGDTFYGGYYFSNSEAGECSVGAAFLVGREGAEERCIGGVAGGGSKLAHAGRSFRKKLAHLLTSTLVDPRHVERLARNADKLLEHPLAVLGEDGRMDKSRVEILVDRLSSHGMGRPTAREVLRWAVYAGLRGEVIPAKLRPAEIASRTWYDVFVAMLRRAQLLPPAAREAVEQTAYNLLLGKFKLN